MTSKNAPATSNPNLEPPTEPGTSAKILGGIPFARYVVAYTIASLAVFACYSALSAILMPNQVQTIEFLRIFEGTGVDAAQLQVLADLNNSGTTPTDATQAANLELFKQYEAARATSLSNIFAIASLFTLFAQPIVGVLSDRTRTARGRRAFWIIAGALGGIVFAVGLRLSTTLAMLAVFWIVTQVSLNFAQAPLTTTIADRIPEKRLGLVSGIAGIGMMVGFLLGSVIAGFTFNVLGLNTYFVFGGIVAVAGAIFVLLAPDTSSKELKLEPFDWIGFFKGFAIPLRDHDFRWVWLARFAFMFGYTAINNYTLYILQGYVQPALSVAEANQWVPILSMIGMPGMLIMMLVSGQWSDKIGRRKPFVAFTSLGFAASLCIPLFWPTLTGVIIYTVLANLFLGAYMALDQALFIDVLPDKAAAGRDLGVANVATNIGQMLAPVVAGQLIAITTGYQSVYITAILFAFIGGIAVFKVRNVK